jgi:hypothetical protein
VPPGEIAFAYITVVEATTRPMVAAGEAMVMNDAYIAVIDVYILAQGAPGIIVTIAAIGGEDHDVGALHQRRYVFPCITSGRLST